MIYVTLTPYLPADKKDESDVATFFAELNRTFVMTALARVNQS